MRGDTPEMALSVSAVLGLVLAVPPWFVDLRRASNSLPGGHWCSGAIVDLAGRRWIASAGHCHWTGQCQDATGELVPKGISIGGKKVQALEPLLDKSVAALRSCSLDLLLLPIRAGLGAALTLSSSSGQPALGVHYESGVPKYFGVARDDCPTTTAPSPIAVCAVQADTSWKPPRGGVVLCGRIMATLPSGASPICFGKGDSGGPLLDSSAGILEGILTSRSADRFAFVPSASIVGPDRTSTYDALKEQVQGHEFDPRAAAALQDLVESVRTLLWEAYRPAGSVP